MRSQSHVVISLGGSEMLAPSCRLVEQPLITYRLSNVSITTAERSRHISLQINGLYQIFRNSYVCYSLGLFFIVFCRQVGLIKLPHLCYKSTGLTLVLFLGSQHFLTQPIARKTRSGDTAQNNLNQFLLQFFFIKD